MPGLAHEVCWGEGPPSEWCVVQIWSSALPRLPSRRVLSVSQVMLVMADSMVAVPETVDWERSSQSGVVAMATCTGVVAC